MLINKKNILIRVIFDNAINLFKIDLQLMKEY